MNEVRIPENAWSDSFYELALKVSGAVQAAPLVADVHGGGYIYSFTTAALAVLGYDPYVRALSVAHLLGHEVDWRNDKRFRGWAGVATRARHREIRGLVWRGKRLL